MTSTSAHHIAINDAAGPFINIYFGKGDGTFTAGPSYATIYGTTDLAAADLDGDGNLDLVVGNGNGGLFGPDENSNGLFAVLMGNGDGTFQAAPSYAATTDGQSVVGPQFAVADFNGDGKPDVLGISTTVQSGIPNPNGLELLTGDGKGNFTPGAPVAGGSPTLVVAADMNGDKNMDAIVADNGSSVGIAFGNGKGSFQAIHDYAVPDSETIQDLAVGDFNGDGKPDVLVTAVDPTGGNPNGIYLFLNNGNGTLAAAKQLDTAITPFGLAIGDLNGDGKLDFVMTDNGNGTNNTQGSMRVYLGDGNGAFANPTSYNPGFSPTSVVIADMNKDGKPDLLVDSINQASTSGTLSIYLGNGDGTLQTPLNTALVDADVGNLTVGDFDGDGNPDVAVADCCGLANSSILFGKGDGAIASQYLLAIGISSNSITAVDVNGDNRPDLVLSLEPASAIQVFLNLYGQASTTTTATTTKLNSSATTVVAGVNVTFTATVVASNGSATPTGTVTFMDGANTLGTGTLSPSGIATYSTSSLSAGSHSISAVYGGDTNFGGSTSAAVTVTVSRSGTTLASTSTTLTASPTNAASGTSIAFSATVAETSGMVTPTGMVTFMDGTTTLGTGMLASGKATYSTSSLAVGSHSITANYGGDSSNAASISSTVSVVIAAAASGDFSIALSPTSGSIAQGSTATTTVSITPNGGFNQQVSFACSGLPKNASCSFNPSTLTPTGTTAATTTLTIKTDVPTAALYQPELPSQGSGAGGTTGLAFLGGGGLLGLTLLRRRKNKGLWYAQLGLALMILVTSAGVGCGGSGPTTPTGTYQVTITGTAGTVTHTATYALTVR